MVRGYAEFYGLEITESDLRGEALEWALARGVSIHSGFGWSLGCATLPDLDSLICAPWAFPWVSDSSEKD